MSQIRVIICGASGQMGKMLVRLVDHQSDMILVGAIDAPDHPDLGKDAGLNSGVGELGVSITDDLTEIIEMGDVVIEFSAPIPTVEHLRQVASANQKFGAKAMVIGTTGANQEQLQEIEQLAQNIPCLMSPNMSLGVNVLLKAIDLVARTLGDEYDVEVIEAHHNIKKDAPSGTAVRISEVLASALGRDIKEVGSYGRRGLVGERPHKEIGIHAVRGGDIVGDHTILFAGVGERLEVVHRAHSRESFAGGAIRAARWIVNAPNGLHGIESVLDLN